MGEADQSVLFTKRLDYEQPVFCWLEKNATERYDIVIEIGANVGLYTVFLDALIRRNPVSRLRTLVGTNESLESYWECADMTRACGIPGVAVLQYAPEHDRQTSDSPALGDGRLEA